MASNLLESGPADFGVAVTPSDSANLTDGDAVAMYVGTAGTLRILCVNGRELTFAAVSSGVLPIKVRRVYSTGTSATNLVALY